MKKILLVDDVKFFIDVQTKLLKRANCDVITASDGKEALELAIKERPDLILMDASLTGMSGDECCRAIKNDPVLNKTPVIMTILKGDEEEKERCVKAGCDDYITKPIDKFELIKKLKSHLDLIIREHIRKPVKMSAFYTFNGQEHPCSVQDVSEGGMFIVSKNPLSLNSSVLLKFTIPSSERPVMALGSVVRVANTPSLTAMSSAGYGIKFVKLPTAGKMAIAKAGVQG